MNFDLCGLALLAVGGVDDKDDASRGASEGSFTYPLTRVRIAMGASGGYSAPRAKAIRTLRGMRQSAQKAEAYTGCTPIYDMI